MKNNDSAWNLILVFIFVLFISLAGYCQEIPAVGMIINVKGTVSAIQQGKEVKAYPMMPLYPGSVLITDKGSEVLMVCYTDSKEYKIEAESRVNFKNKLPSPVKGNAVASVSNSKIPLPSDTEISSRKIMGNLERNVPPEMENSIQIIHPRYGEVLISPECIVFKWTGVESPRCEIIIRNEDLPDPIISMETDNTGQYVYKAGNTEVSLDYGKKYVFSVREEIGPDIIQKDREFTILPYEKSVKIQEARKEFDRIIKEEPGNSTVRIIMADLYYKNNMLYDSLDILYPLGKEANPYIYYRMAEIYVRMGDKTNAQKYYDLGVETEKGGH